MVPVEKMQLLMVKYFISILKSCKMLEKACNVKSLLLATD